LKQQGMGNNSDCNNNRENCSGARRYLSGAVKSTGQTTINLADQGAHAAIMEFKSCGFNG